jgi:hypothetical protein
LQGLIQEAVDGERYELAEKYKKQLESGFSGLKD